MALAVVAGWIQSLTAGRKSNADRRRRAEPNAGPRTPRVCPHRMTRNTGKAQCAHTVDPCNKLDWNQWSTLFRHRWPTSSGIRRSYLHLLCNKRHCRAESAVKDDSASAEIVPCKDRED